MAFVEDLSRRKFLSGTGVLALAPMALNRFELTASAAAAPTSGTVIKRKLGKTDIEIPIVSMGVMNADNPAVLQESYKLGVRFFDTAAGYQGGRNEEMVGKVIKDMGIRNQVYVQTKFNLMKTPPEQRKQTLLKELDNSLARLGMAYVDVFLLHQPPADVMTDSNVKEALQEMKKLKKARYVGVSHHAGQAEVLNVAVKEGIYDAATVSYNFTMAQDTALLEAIRNAAKAGLGVIAMKSQATGRGQTGFVNQTAALKWVLRNPEITTAIPGYTNFDHMKEDFSVALGLDYNNDEKKFLAEKNLQASVQFCQQCENCVPTCPNGVDIPTLMRTHMYAAKYGNFVHARATLDEIAANVGLKNCADCSGCSAKCVNYIRIADNIRDLKAMYL
jgi:predicted aldo/keto reductase-like oxidoreductase